MNTTSTYLKLQYLTTLCHFFIITPEEVESVLSNITIGKAAGPDGIHNKVLREESKELNIPLCDLFNQSLDFGILLESWKQARVSAIFKKGEPSLVSNYRPISLLSNLDKVFERMVFKHLYNYLHDIKYLSSFNLALSQVIQPSTN